MADPSALPEDSRDQRRFAVSANRGRARHKVRYVETGGSAVDVDECTFCQATPDLSGTHVVSPSSDRGPNGSSECS